MGANAETLELKEEAMILYKSGRTWYEILKYLSPMLRGIISRVCPTVMEKTEEIRMRGGKPLIIQNYREEWFAGFDGRLYNCSVGAYTVSSRDINDTLQLMSQNSIYAYQEEIKKGYITLPGGHRIGITGKAVLADGCIRNIKEVSGLNIRFAKQIPGCGKEIIRYMFDKGSLMNTLIISAPQCGKTTILRDIARLLSDGVEGLNPLKTGIVDERSEIAACLNGIPQFDTGIRTDILDGCPKSTGMSMLIRSMSPQVVITDELGSAGDARAVMEALNAGVKVVATAHGDSLEEVEGRYELKSLVEQKAFDRYIILDSFNGPGSLKEVVGGKKMVSLYRRNTNGP